MMDETQVIADAVERMTGRDLYALSVAAERWIGTAREPLMGDAEFKAAILKALTSAVKHAAV